MSSSWSIGFETPRRSARRVEWYSSENSESFHEF